MSKWKYFRAHPHDDERIIPNYLEIDNLITEMQSRTIHWNNSAISARYTWATKQALNFRATYKLLELVEDIGADSCFDFLMALKMRIEYPVSKKFSMRQMDLVVNHKIDLWEDEGESIVNCGSIVSTADWLAQKKWLIHGYDGGIAGPFVNVSSKSPLEINWPDAHDIETDSDGSISGKFENGWFHAIMLNTVKESHMASSLKEL